MRSLLLAIALLLMAAPSWSQSVQQSGTVTPGHVPSWAVSGVVQDAGTATQGKINSLGLYGLGGTPLCITNSPTPAPFGVVPYSQFCLGISGTAAYLMLNSYNGASSLPIQVVVNGTAIPITPNAAAAWATRQIASGTTDSASPILDGPVGQINWNSGTAAPKTQTLFACTSAVNGYHETIADEYGQNAAGGAGVYAITITPSSGTIAGKSSYPLNSNGAVVALTCDGVSNWVIN